MDYFKEIMAAHHKPYLILQLDEHESNVGYETRIEAAIRSFQNHHAVTRRNVPVSASARFPVTSKDLSHKTLIIPNWDNITFQFLVANLRREGIDARLMEESRTTIQKSLRYNTGQCIPLNIIAQEFVEYVKSHHLDPEKPCCGWSHQKSPAISGCYPTIWNGFFIPTETAWKKPGCMRGTCPSWTFL